MFKTILAFEVVSATEWGHIPIQNFRSNYSVILDGGCVDKKMQALLEYAKEMREYPHTRSMENIRHVMNVRGAGVSYEHCEAFELVRMII